MRPVTIAPGHWLDAPAAASYARMRLRGMPAGGINDAGRTHAEQVAMFARFGWPRAARPGTSRHESGAALDVATLSAAWRWLVRHGAEHGWHRPLSFEPWHFEYDPARDRHRVVAPAPAPAPVPPAPPAPTDWFTMATREDLAAVVADALAAHTGPLVLLRVAGTQAAYADLGTARRWISGAQLVGRRAWITDLPPADPFWHLPVVGLPGEVYRRPLTEDPTGRAYQLERAVLRPLERADYEALGSPLITDLAGGHALWRLPVA